MLGLTLSCVEPTRHGGPLVVRPVPDLAQVLPGVRVIADYEEAVFYDGVFYYWSCGHRWYRSKSYTSGWEVIEAPPRSIRRIERPDAYRHFRPYNYVARRRAAPFQRFDH